jgi:hypothetical protein
MSGSTAHRVSRSPVISVPDRDKPRSHWLGLHNPGYAHHIAIDNNGSSVSVKFLTFFSSVNLSGTSLLKEVFVMPGADLFSRKAGPVRRTEQSFWYIINSKTEKDLTGALLIRR